MPESCVLIITVIGTLWNTLGIGLSLYGLVKLGVFSIEITIVDCLLFGSLISAVDPVSVLAIFEEIHVNEILYIIMFGESLLNDGICVVLYNLFLSFKTSSHVTLDYNDLLTGVSSFAFVAMGGIAVGLMVGIIASYVTKYTNKTPNIEPLFMLAMAYLSYLISDLFQISGIMAIISCAIVNQHYASHNLSMHSNNCVANLLAMLSSVCESMIFLWMGISIFGDYHLWNSYFIFFSLLFCFIFRASGIIVLVWIANQRRLIKLDNLEQFILSYSGLRGAISFSLALSLIKNEHLTEDLKRMFLTTTIIIVLFTTFFQGMTIKPLVDYLRIKKSEDNSKLLSAIVFGRFLKHLVNGMESIVSPQEFFLFKEKMRNFDTNQIKPILIRGTPITKDKKLIEICHNLNIDSLSKHVMEFGGNHCKLCRLFTKIDNFYDPQRHSFSENRPSSLSPKEMRGMMDIFPSEIINQADLHHIFKFKNKKPPRNKANSRQFLIGEDLFLNKYYKPDEENESNSLLQSKRTLDSSLAIRKGFNIPSNVKIIKTTRTQSLPKIHRSSATNPLTIAELTLPWKTPTKVPVKMPSPTRVPDNLIIPEKMHSPTRIPSIVESYNIHVNKKR
ncbi:unnamed protein product [Gordionus sp. m RMFG-2023]